MSLRRTGIARKSELARKTELQRSRLVRKRELRARSVKAVRRERDTGPTPAQRNLVLERAAGCCELCQRILHDGNQWIFDHSVHHRRARGIGGTTRPETNEPSNLLLVCGSGTTHCHGLIESNRTNSYALGWLVHQTDDPATIPVLLPEAIVYGLRIDARAVLLTTDGEYQEVAA